MRSGFLPARVVHLHPTRACNLACAHCYSESSPDRRGALGTDVVIEALARLRVEGYEIVSVSGGEPLVYRGLDRVAAAATESGYRVHMITNGVLLSPKRLAALQAHVQLIGVSLDGTEETHNAVRRRPDAFRNAMKALRALAASDVPFGIVYGVSARSLGDIPWAFETARELGASLLHLRPLAPEGRARTMTNEWVLTEEDCVRLIVLGELLQAMGPDAPRVQLDLASVEDLIASRDQFELLRPSPSIERLSDAVNPLIIDDEGRCLPFAYGMDPSFEIARVPGDADAFRPRSEPLVRIRALLARAFDEAALDGAAGSPYMDWFAHLTRVSRRMDAPLPLPTAAPLTAPRPGTPADNPVQLPGL